MRLPPSFLSPLPPCLPHPQPAQPSPSPPTPTHSRAPPFGSMPASACLSPHPVDPVNGRHRSPLSPSHNASRRRFGRLLPGRPRTMERLRCSTAGLHDVRSRIRKLLCDPPPKIMPNGHAQGPVILSGSWPRHCRVAVTDHLVRVLIFCDGEGMPHVEGEEGNVFASNLVRPA